MTLLPESARSPARPPTHEQNGTGTLPAPPHPLLQPDRRWALSLAGLLVLYLSQPLAWHLPNSPLWFPPLGLGLVLAVWLGRRTALLVTLASLLAAVQAHLVGTPTAWGSGWLAAAGHLAEALLQGGEVAVAVWLYETAA